MDQVSRVVTTGSVSATEADSDGENTDSCLVGDWQVADYAAFMLAALEMAGATNSLYPITFDAATITYAASEFELKGSASVEGIAIAVTIRLEGEATASYEGASDGTIAIIQYDTSRLSIVSAVSPLTNDSASMLRPEQWIFFLSPTYGYTCTDTTPELTIPPLTIPVVLNRR